MSKLALKGGQPEIGPSELPAWPQVTPEDQEAVLEVLRSGEMGRLYLDRCQALRDGNMIAVDLFTRQIAKRSFQAAQLIGKMHAMKFIDIAATFFFYITAIARYDCGKLFQATLLRRV